MDTLFGLKPAEWTAVGTVALVVVTAVYVALTWRMARHARSSAAASKESAEASARAAEAAERSASIAEASLEVDFSAAYEKSGLFDSRGFIVLTCLGAKVYLHGVSVEGVVKADKSDDLQTVQAELRPRRLRENLQVMRANEELPRLLHRSERALFEWPGPSLKVGATHAAVAHIEYSATPDAPVRKISRNVDFVFSSP